MSCHAAAPPALDLLAMVLFGLLGSTHCLAMCSGFVACLGRQKRLGALYQVGRLLAYATLGGIAAALGGETRLVVGPFVLIAAGLLMVLMGLAMAAGGWNGAAGLVPRGPLTRLLAAMLRRPSPRAAFGLGSLTGLLPCGLLYAAVTRAAASPGVLEGSAVMAAFWLGTAPALVGVSLLGPLLGRLPLAPPGGRPILTWWPRLAGGAAVLLGLLTLARAV